MAGNSIAEDIDSFFTAVSAVSQELLPSQEADDIFLTIQRASHEEYWKKLRIFLSQCEADKITKLCNAAESNEKLFWKVIKSQRSSMSYECLCSEW